MRHPSPRFILSIASFLFFPALSLTALATTYEVGPSEPLTTIAAVPWASLEPGDVVSIHWQATPYKEKWVICRAGTPNAPITVRGIPGPGGELPRIDGADAVTVPSLDYSGEIRSVIKIGTANNPGARVPENIVIANLDVSNAHPDFSFNGRKGLAKYNASAAAIWVEEGRGIVISGCAIHGSANGLFASQATRGLLVKHCHIFGNGLFKSGYQHNSYTEAIGVTFQFNHFGPLRPGSLGNNLKDRSANLVVRDNWIEGGSRELDLVDAEDSELIRNHPGYRETKVYNNVLIKLATDANNQVVHYGGDSGKADWERKGTLRFFNNTVVSQRPGTTTLFRLTSNEDHVDARNNIFYTEADGRRLALVESAGTVDLASNWIKPGWVNCHGSFSGTVAVGSGNIGGKAPGFVNERSGDYRLAPDSPCRSAGIAILPENGAPSGGRADLGAPGSMP